MSNESKRSWRRGGPILGALAVLGVAAALACTGSSREPVAVAGPFAEGQAGDDETAAVEETPNGPRTESRYGIVGREQAEPEVPGERAGSTAGVARVYLDYKDLRKRENGSSERLVLAERVSDRDDAMASVQRTVKRTVLSFQAGEALQIAANALGAEDAQRAAGLLAERRELLEAAADLWRDPALRRDAALLGRYEAVVARAWPSFGHDDRRTLVMAMSWFGDQRMR